MKKTARGMIQDVDKARENCRRKYCKDIAGIFDNRDICIDSGKFGADISAEILCGVVRSCIWADIYLDKTKSPATWR